MRQFIIIFIFGIITGVATILLFYDKVKPCDPEVIIREIPVPEPYPVSVPVPEPVWIDTSSIWRMALSTIDSNYIKSLVWVDTADIIREALSKIDTSDILRDYYSTYHYDQTISDDTLFAINLTQRISENKIIGQEAKFTLLKNEIKYINVPTATNYIYVGGVLNTGLRAGITPSITYSNDRALVGAGYDPFNKIFLIDAKIKLFSWQ